MCVYFPLTLHEKSWDELDQCWENKEVWSVNTVRNDKDIRILYHFIILFCIHRWRRDIPLGWLSVWLKYGNESALAQQSRAAPPSHPLHFCFVHSQQHTPWSHNGEVHGQGGLMVGIQIEGQEGDLSQRHAAHSGPPQQAQGSGLSSCIQHGVHGEI